LTVAEQHIFKVQSVCFYLRPALNDLATDQSLDQWSGADCWSRTFNETLFQLILLSSDKHAYVHMGLPLKHRRYTEHFFIVQLLTLNHSSAPSQQCRRPRQPPFNLPPIAIA